METRQVILNALKNGIPPYVVHFALENQPDLLDTDEEVEVTPEVTSVIREEFLKVGKISALSEDEKKEVNQLSSETDSVYHIVLDFYLKHFFEEDLQERTNNVYFYLIDKVK